MPEQIPRPNFWEEDAEGERRVSKIVPNPMERSLHEEVVVDKEKQKKWLADEQAAQQRIKQLRESILGPAAEQDPLKKILRDGKIEDDLRESMGIQSRGDEIKGEERVEELRKTIPAAEDSEPAPPWENAA
jgi:anti-sigma28 factor (negative regulator of flagellin synthesis)